MDSLLEKSSVATEVLKCIHIGLLCVQEDPVDRPTMSSVVVMLAGDNLKIPIPTKPAFSVGRIVAEETTSSNQRVSSVNKVTLSNVLPRWLWCNSSFFLVTKMNGGKQQQIKFLNKTLGFLRSEFARKRRIKPFWGS